MQTRLLILFCGVLFLCGCAGKNDYSPQNLKHYTARQLLRQGEHELAEGGYTRAAKYFEAIEALYPFDPEAQQSQLDIIFAYYKAEDYPSALAAADGYLHLYPVGEHTDYAYYMKGVISYDTGRTHLQKMFPSKVERLDIVNWRKAFVSFDTLIKTFPHSIYAPDAKKRMIYIRNALAAHEIHIAKFYLERKAYIAAANRASEVLQRFVGAPQGQEALQIMLRAYNALGLVQQAQDVRRVIQMNPH